MAHGIRGLVKVLVLAEDETLLNKHAPYTAATGDKTLTLRLKNSLGNKDGRFWLASVEGIADRTAAEKLRGTGLWIDQDKLPKIKNPKEFYVTDLKGLRVIDQEGNLIGHIMGVDNFGAGDLLEIKPATGESFYLPYTQDNVVKIDMTAQTVTVDLPEGIGND